MKKVNLHRALILAVLLLLPPAASHATDGASLVQTIGQAELGIDPDPIAGSRCAARRPGQLDEQPAQAIVTHDASSGGTTRGHQQSLQLDVVSRVPPPVVRICHLGSRSVQSTPQSRRRRAGTSPV